MQDQQIYLTYIGNIVSSTKAIVAEPANKLLLVPMAAASMYTTTEKTLIFLAVLFLFDFITGIGASWVEFKKATPLVPGSVKRYLLSSAKLRLSAVKFTTYAMGIISAYGLECIFVIQEFQPGHFIQQKLTVTTIVTLFFCVIEFYSIFFENFKRMGFDIIQKVKNIFATGWDVYKTTKNDTKKEE
jgi:phage-related holin